mmetsp:Transcript_85790/g.255772  ORF Transcript_85790/g.255772 Transcript_85790/m.255772 type:complete len:224 (+) Transcript_85790:304-975(+)
MLCSICTSRSLRCSMLRIRLSTIFCFSISVYSWVSLSRIRAWMFCSCLSSSFLRSFSSICLSKYAWFSFLRCCKRFCLRLSASKKCLSISSCCALARCASLSPAPRCTAATFSCSFSISDACLFRRFCSSSALCSSCSSMTRLYSLMASASFCISRRFSCSRRRWSSMFSSKTLRMFLLVCSLFRSKRRCSASISSTIFSTREASSFFFRSSSWAFSFRSKFS